MKKMLVLFFTHLSFIGLMTPVSTLSYGDNPFSRAIRNEIVNSIELAPRKEEKPVVIKEKSFMDKIRLLWTKQEIKMPEVSDRQKLEITFDQMSPSEIMPDKPVIDFETINKLEILQGGAHGAENLINQLITIHDGQGSKKLLYTTPGLKVMTELISMPTTDIATIQSRQTAIKELLVNNSLRNACITLLYHMKKAELYLYHMYTKDGLSEEEQFVYPGRVLKMLKLDEFPLAISAANILYAAYPWIMQTLLFVTTLTAPKLMEKVGVPIAIKATERHLQKKLTTQEKMKLKQELQDFFKSEEIQQSMIITQSALGASAIMQLPQTLATTGVTKASFETILHFQEQLINVASYIKNAQELLRLISNNNAINTAMPHFKKEWNNMVVTKQGSARFNKLQELLNSSTFAGPEPSLFSSPGNILVAYKLFSEKNTRSYYRQLLQLVGEIDTYVALAQKIKFHENLPAKFCFAQLDLKSVKPYIKATAVWNPFLPTSLVVTNALNLNTGNEQSILLTGPNTSGKSTLLKAIIISILMTQTFGIAPAQAFELTPFAKLLSYLNITDDTQAGVSQFKAEVLRAEMLAKTITELQPHEFAFIGIDEIFTGTEPTQAELMSYNFIKHLSTFPNVLFINSTHFSKLTALEQETNGKIKNYHMGAIVNAAGKVIRYTRKLVPGKAEISSAEQVAKEGEILGKWINQ